MPVRLDDDASREAVKFNDQHHRIAASDVSMSNSAPTAIPVHAFVRFSIQIANVASSRKLFVAMPILIPRVMICKSGTNRL